MPSEVSGRGAGRILADSASQQPLRGAASKQIFLPAGHLLGLRTAWRRCFSPPVLSPLSASQAQVKGAGGWVTGRLDEPKH